MNSSFNSKSIFFVTLLILIKIGLTGCKVEPNPDVIGEFSNKLLLNRIDNAQSGIIGGYEFYQEYPEFLDDAVNAVGSLAIYDKDGKLVDGAVGMHIKDSASEYEFLLTATHLIYDPITGNRKGDQIFFGYEKDAQENIIQDIRNWPENQSDIHEDDWVLIRVNPHKHRNPYIVNLKNKDFYLNTTPSQEYSGYFVSISSFTDNDNIGAIRFVQKAKKLYTTNIRNKKIVVTSLDAINGMSGSPVFYTENKKLYLIGVVRGRSKVRGCEDIKVTMCGNRISLLPTHKIKGPPSGEP